MANYAYQWGSGQLHGLKLKLGYAKGSGIENSVNKNLGQATEPWFETDLKYQPPKFKKIALRLLHRDYKSTIIGEVAGVKDDRRETRLTVDFKHHF